MTSSPRAVANVVDYLTACSDPEFSQLVINRHITSYANGILTTNTTDERCRFIPWGHKDIDPNMVACKFFNRVLPVNAVAVHGYGQRLANETMQMLTLGASAERDANENNEGDEEDAESKELRAQLLKENPTGDWYRPEPFTQEGGDPVMFPILVPNEDENGKVTVHEQMVESISEHRIAYTDAVTGERVERNKYLEEYGCWANIPTPYFDKILEHQCFPPEVMRWVYIMFGRMAYELNQRDEWQIIMFCKGLAGTGKSTLGALVEKLYEPQDVATIGNKIEAQFGLDGIYERLIWVCNEVRANFGLDQGHFQSMVTGERVPIGRKFKTALSVQWKSPGWLSGNEAFNYQDTSGSVARRTLVAEFQSSRATPTSTNSLRWNFPCSSSRRIWPTGRP